MRLFLGLVLFVITSCTLFADEGRDALHLALPQDLARLVQAHEQLRAAYQSAGSTLPPAFSDVLVVRRTIAADWQKRIAQKSEPIDLSAAVRFRSELTVLIASIQQLSNTAQQYSYASQRFPHCLDEPVFKRYRAQLVNTVEAGVQTIIAGRSPDNAANVRRSQQRYTDLLTIIESQFTLNERYGKLPPKLPALKDYREHLRLTRAEIEPQLDAPDRLTPPIDLDAITKAFDALLDAHVNVVKAAAANDLPADAPASAGYHAVLINLITVLTDQLTFVRTTSQDDDQHYQKSRALNQRQIIALHLVDAAERWKEGEINRRKERQEQQESLTAISKSIRERVVKQSAELDQQRRLLEQSIMLAFKEQNALAAIEQAGKLSLLELRESQVFVTMVDDAEFEEREADWKALATDPNIAKLLLTYETHKTAYVTKREQAQRANVAAKELELHSELLSLRASLATNDFDVKEEESYRLREPLEDSAQAVEEAVQLRGDQ
jgi:hypothetical protein